LFLIVLFLFEVSRVRKVKQKVYPDEINRNGRTALLINKSQKRKKNQTITNGKNNAPLFLYDILKNQI
jgi:hypothetical protein